MSTDHTTTMEDALDARSRDHYKQSVVLQRTEGSDVQDPQLLRRRSLTIAHLYLTCASLSRTRTRSLTRTVSVQTLPNSDTAGDGGSNLRDQNSDSPFQRQRPKSEYPLRPLTGKVSVNSDGVGHSETSSSGQRPKSEHSLRPPTGKTRINSDGVKHSETLTSLHQKPKSEYPFDLPSRETSARTGGVNFSEIPIPGLRPKSEHPRRRPRRGFSVDRPHQDQATKEETVPSVTHRPRVGLAFERPKSEHHSRRPLLEYRDVIVRESDQKRVVPRRPRSERPDSGCADSKTRTSRRKP